MNLASLLHMHGPLVLASQSPRRLALLRQMGCEPRVVPADVPEHLHAAGEGPGTYASALAQEKARVVWTSVPPESIVIAADTIVVIDEEILNKPVDEADAVRMLRRLSGRTHTVITAVCVRTATSDIVRQSTTRVTFRTLGDEEIGAYVRSGSPMDKAGAYGIQDDFGAVFVRHIEGCYYTIVGLPLAMLYEMLRELTVRETDRAGGVA
ncbi:MAG: Maf family protein [Candidatus Kapaibacterium sp.]